MVIITNTYLYRYIILTKLYFMKVLGIILLAIYSTISANVYAPNYNDQFKSKEIHVEQILKFNDVLKEKYNYYPCIDTNIINMDINYMKHTLHKMLIVEATTLQEIGLTFNDYDKLNQNQKWNKAYNKKEGATGNMQIRWVMWQHLVNELKLCNYKLSDRWNANKSFNMFIIFQNYYNPSWSLEKASRDWNGGGNMGLHKKTTLKYYKQVKLKYDTLLKELEIDLS